MKIRASCVALMFVWFTSTSFAETIEVSVAPIDIMTTCTLGAVPPAGELVITVPVGVLALVTGMGWNTTQTAFPPNILSNMTFRLYGEAYGNVMDFRPGFENSMPGGPINYASNGIVDFSDSGFEDIELADGQLRIGICQAGSGGTAPFGRFSAPSTLTINCHLCKPRIFSHGFD